jgi:hypothetical protein
MTPLAPFHVTVPVRPSLSYPFDTLDDAHAYARSLLARDVPSTVTDGTGQIVGTYELFGGAFETTSPGASS